MSILNWGGGIVMNLDNVYIADIETVGLLDAMPDSFDGLHVLSCAYKKSDGTWDIISTNDRGVISRLVGNPDNTIVMHNGINFDRPALRKIGVEFNAKIIDTLPLSYYLYNERDKHGLESWGEFFGVKKPEISSWTGLTYEEYKHRCEEDCKIGTNLWLMMLDYLRRIYDTDEQIVSVIEYLNHKMEMLFLQDQNPILIDVEQCKKNLEYLENIISEKESELNSIMPKIPITATRTKPKALTKKDGSLSAAGTKWMEMLKGCNLPDDYDGEITEIVRYDEPNCQSVSQMKQFLTDLGWVPTIFKDGANGKVAQLRDDEKNLCPNIQKLIEKEPKLESLSGLSVAQHRAGYLKAFLAHVDEKGYAKAWAHSFTRTLRLKHSNPFVNLPKPNSTYGELIRSVMIAPEGYVCIGADLSSIEDKCKQISIFDLDPEYVESMNTKGWDAHLALGLKAGFFTESEVVFYKWFKNKGKADSAFECPEEFKSLNDTEKEALFHKLDKIRGTSKTGTYALTYSCGVAKLSEVTDLPRKDAQNLYDGYHRLNWSVKEFANSRIVKSVKGRNWTRLNKKAGGLQEVFESNWIWNQYSKMWLPLKNDKDRFSACNQNMGVKVFDVWCWFLSRRGIRFSGQWHDECFWYCKEDEVDAHIEHINYAITQVNKVFNPPVPIECDYKVGKNYAEVH